MTAVFADAVYWVAILDILDNWHHAARMARRRLGRAQLITTDEVLVEVLNAFSGRGAQIRQISCALIYQLRRDPDIVVLEQSRASFDAGLILYDTRHDKGYSLVDCISMTTMRRLGLRQVLTHDHHFEQEGFEILIR